PLRSPPFRCSARRIGLVAPSPPPDWLPGLSLLGRRRVSPGPTSARPPFHALYAAGFFGAAAPSASPLPWPSPTQPRLGSSRRGRLRLMLRTGGLHPPLVSQRGLDPALQRPDLSVRWRAATKVAWSRL